MKKKGLLLACVAMIYCVAVSSKDYTISIKGKSGRGKEKTEVSTGSSGTVDTLTVIPGRDVELIDIILKDVLGNVLEQHRVSATCDDRLFILSPELPEGYVLEVKDDRGTIYTQYED